MKQKKLLISKTETASKTQRLTWRNLKAGKWDGLPCLPPVSLTWTPLSTNFAKSRTVSFLPDWSHHKTEIKQLGFFSFVCVLANWKVKRFWERNSPWLGLTHSDSAACVELVLHHSEQKIYREETYKKKKWKLNSSITYIQWRKQTLWVRERERGALGFGWEEARAV